ncbi:MAG: hypothetical protein WC529_02035 [Candidatus Margulisiibacteriota bacterium]
MNRRALPAGRQGFSLIEATVGLVVIGIAFYLLAAIFINLAPRTARVETIDKKAYLAHAKMEEYTARTFVQATTGETSGSFSGAFAGYQYRIIVTRVATSDLNTPVSYNTPFKNIKVRVWGGPLDRASTVEITALLATYEVH